MAYVLAIKPCLFNLPRVKPYGRRLSLVGRHSSRLGTSEFRGKDIKLQQTSTQDYISDYSVNMYMFNRREVGGESRSNNECGRSRRVGSGRALKLSNQLCESLLIPIRRNCRSRADHEPLRHKELTGKRSVSTVM